MGKHQQLDEIWHSATPPRRFYGDHSYVAGLDVLGGATPQELAQNKPTVNKTLSLSTAPTSVVKNVNSIVAPSSGDGGGGGGGGAGGQGLDEEDISDAQVEPENYYADPYLPVDEGDYYADDEEEAYDPSVGPRSLADILVDSHNMQITDPVVDPMRSRGAAHRAVNYLQQGEYSGVNSQGTSGGSILETELLDPKLFVFGDDTKGKKSKLPYYLAIAGVAGLLGYVLYRR